jgi:hypothetical protein
VRSEQPPMTAVRTELPSEPRGWWLENDDAGVTARCQGSQVAQVDVQDKGDRVDLVFWFDEPVPAGMATDLAREAFQHPALQPHRPVTVALPRRRAELLGELRAHLVGSTTHVAGTTCLVAGRLR